MSQDLNPIRDALNVIRTRLVRTHPCAHENADTNLGNGQVWAKCEDCGHEFLQENWGKARARSAEHGEALEHCDKLIDLVQEAWVIAQKKVPGLANPTPGLAEAKADGIQDTLVAKLLFASAEDAELYIGQNLIHRMPDVREHYEVVPAYIMIP